MPLNSAWSEILFQDYRGQQLYWRIKGNYYDRVLRISWSEWSNVGAFYLDKFPTSLTANFTNLPNNQVQVSGELKGKKDNKWPIMGWWPLSYREIIIQYFVGDQIFSLATIKVGNWGDYSYSWSPTISGFYQLKFEGDQQYKDIATNSTFITVQPKTYKPKIKFRVIKSFHKKVCKKNKKYHSKHCKSNKNFNKHKKRCTKVISK